MIKFIVGTDTDAGKTYYGKNLAKKGNYVIKPIETGFNSFKDINKSDAYSYAKILDVDINEINLWFYKIPASPHLAAKLDKTSVDIDVLCDFILKKYKKHQKENENNQKSFYVELAGGLIVPLTREFTQLDLLEKINKIEKVEVDLVVGNKLGCINHALMTISILKKAGLDISHIEINNFGKEPSEIMLDNEKVIRDYYQKQFK